MFLLIDNYDSFVYNLMHFLGELGAEIEVRRNDALTVDQALAMEPEGIIISPGPCDPDKAGICLDLIREGAGRVPILGVCLGHQAIGQAFGGKVDHGDRPPRAHDPRRAVPPREHRLRAWPQAARQFPVDDDPGPSAEPDAGADAGAPGAGMSSAGTGEVADFKAILAQVASGGSLSRAQAEAAFEVMMSGEATPAQIGAFLMGLRVRGETVEEITGAATVMRAKAVRVDAPAGTIDTCGTGGDASGTFNVSTGAAIVVAACGVPVAKHGNRAASSKSGSSDVLAALGVNIDADMALVARALADAGICFMMAPRHHGAMRHVAGARVELGTRTIFNILGPLSNPADAKRQLLGVFSRQWLEPMARVLGNLGSQRAWLVHGSDGLDELTTTGPSYVAELRGGDVRTFEVTPEQAGLETARPDDLKGGDAATNAAAMRAMLGGERGPYRDIVLLNSAAALMVADRAGDLREGAEMARAAIDAGTARDVLDRLIRITNETGAAA